MATHVIIDGYNLIRQSPSLAALDQTDIQLGREALIDRLVDYKKLRGHRITVVFDGHTAPPANALRRDRFRGIDIVFSRMGETADAVIMRMAAREKQRGVIVSSDREIQRVAAAKHAAVIGSRAFEEKLDMAVCSTFKEDEEDTDTITRPLTTRKKGPSRRLPRKIRRQLRKTRHL